MTVHRVVQSNGDRSFFPKVIPIGGIIYVPSTNVMYIIYRNTFAPCFGHQIMVYLRISVHECLIQACGGLLDEFIKNPLHGTVDYKALEFGVFKKALLAVMEVRSTDTIQ